MPKYRMTNQTQMTGEVEVIPESLLADIQDLQDRIDGQEQTIQDLQSEIEFWKHQVIIARTCT